MADAAGDLHDVIRIHPLYRATVRHADGQIEALEFSITEGNQIIGKALKDIDMRGKGIIAGVTKKDGRTLIPGGLYVIEEGDALITVIERKSTDFIQKLLHVGSFMEKD